MKQVKNFILSLIAIIFIAIPSTIIAGNIYVDGEHGSDETGDGSETNPYATIQKAVDEADDDQDPPNDEILVDPKNDDGSAQAYGGATIDGKTLAIKRWGSSGGVWIHGNDGADGDPPGDGEAGLTITGGADVALETVYVHGGSGGASTNPDIDGGEGAPGISADGAGTTVTKTSSLVSGGDGGFGAYGGGDAGDGGKGEQANGAHITNLFEAPSIGGPGGGGGANPAGPGGGGGDGGTGAEAINSGYIEYVPSSMPSGGEGGIGGSGQPDGSPGSPGLDTYADPTSEIVMIEDIPTLSEWGLIVLALLVLAIGTVAVIRRRRVVIAKN